MKSTMKVLTAAIFVAVVSFPPISAQLDKRKNVKPPPQKSPQLTEDSVGTKNPNNPLIIGTSDESQKLLDKLLLIYRQPGLEIERIQKVEQGYSGSGVVIHRSSELITIDTTPCSNKKQLMKFHKVYMESEISDINCQGKKYPRSKVRQQ